MLNRWFHVPVLHEPRLGHSRRVGWLELFFDLIFVAAIIQLGDALSHHADLPGFLAFVGLFVPIWSAWTTFTFYANRFVVDDFLHRGLVFLQMFGIGGMAVAVPQVLEHDPTAFIGSYSLVRWVIVALYARVWWQQPAAREITRRYTLGFAAGALLWTASAFLPEPWTYLLWALALGIDFATPLTPHARELAGRYPPDLLHMTERYGLLTIIVLGETFVKVLTAMANEGTGFSIALMGVVGVVVTVSIWWIYFDDVAGSRIRKGRLNPYVWIYSHLPLTLAITGVGVAIKKATLFVPGEIAPAAYRWLLVGTLSLTLLSVAAIDAVTERRQAELSDRSRVNLRLLSAALVLVVGFIGGFVVAGVFVGMVAAVCVLQVLADLVIAPTADPEAAHHEDPGALRASLAAPTAPTAPTGTQPRRWDISESVRKGTPNELRRDLYVSFMDGSWGGLLATLTVIYLMVNAVFAALYLLDPTGVANATPGSFLDAFFFSVQTLTTIGYGALSPASEWANLLVTIEAGIGILGVALITGLVFAKAARPRSSVLFSDPVVISIREGKPTLMFRVGNARGNEIVEANIRVSALVEELSPEGHQMRRLYDLELVRSNTPLFTLSWTVMHVLGPESCLHGLSAENVEERLVSLVVTMMGHDATYAQTVHARRIYWPEAFRFGHRLVDVISSLPDGRLLVDYAHFHETEGD